MVNFHRHIWGIYENDDALQKTNKDRTNDLLPPSSAKFGGRIWGGILKRGYSLFSYVEGQSRRFTNVSFLDLTGILGEIQIVEKDWMSRQVFNNRCVIGRAANMEFAMQ
jgi:hypothetical protein